MRFRPGRSLARCARCSPARESSEAEPPRGPRHDDGETCAALSSVSSAVRLLGVVADHHGVGLILVVRARTGSGPCCRPSVVAPTRVDGDEARGVSASDGRSPACPAYAVQRISAPRRESRRARGTRARTDPKLTSPLVASRKAPAPRVGLTLTDLSRDCKRGNGGGRGRHRGAGLPQARAASRRRLSTRSLADARLSSRSRVAVTLRGLPQARSPRRPPRARRRRRG
jgi:hypothetical protein